MPLIPNAGAASTKASAQRQLDRGRVFFIGTIFESVRLFSTRHELREFIGRLTEADSKLTGSGRITGQRTLELFDHLARDFDSVDCRGRF